MQGLRVLRGLGFYGLGCMASGFEGLGLIPGYPWVDEILPIQPQ